MHQRQVHTVSTATGWDIHGHVETLLARMSAHRPASRAVGCLECGVVRLVRFEAGECPACGYLGWRQLERAER